MVSPPIAVVARDLSVNFTTALLVGDRCTEQRHDPVAGILIDVTSKR
jgi:hypothetical protein